MDFETFDSQFREHEDEKRERLQASYTRRRRAMGYLRMFGPDTYGLSIERDLAKYMERQGWIEWVPPKFGTTLWAITEAGRAAIANNT